MTVSRIAKYALTLAMAFLILPGCGDDDDDPIVCPDPEIPVLAFVGSETCKECHEAKYDMWVESGHPFKLTKILGEAPTGSFPGFSEYPNDAVEPPAGFTWADISYTIGGYAWKMRFINQDGWIITGLEDNQYNFEQDLWSDYHLTDPPNTKPYDCGKCHTTGWVADSDPTTDGDLTDNQDGMPGMYGTFFAGGIHCEECHGRGSLHVLAPDLNALEVDNSSEQCGRCHTRDALNRIAASGGFIEHHEQYDEWLHSPHAIGNGPGCSECHDPHASVMFDDVAMGIGVKTSCTDCHAAEDYTLDGGDVAHLSADFGGPACVDCHMPKSAKSALAITIHQGDVRSHIWAINPAAVDKEEGMGIVAASTTVLEDPATGLARVTLDFACYSCHKDADGVGGGVSQRTLEELSAMATGIHPVSARTLAAR